MNESFVAYCDCPHCGLHEYHRFRMPNGKPTLEVYNQWWYNHKTIRTYGGVVTHIPPEPKDESMYETIRICKCGYEWGQM